MLYSLDTNVFVQAWRRNYPPAAFPSVWRRLESLIAAGDAAATEYVRFELEKQDDEILQWASAQALLFQPIDEEIQRAVKAILVRHRKLLDDRRGRSGADPFVIGFAQIHGAAVVTEERRTNSPTRPNIPDVCADLGIRCVSLVDLMTERSWSF